MQHAYHKGLSIVVDVSGINDFKSINFAAVDLDHFELWRFQYFNDAGELLEVHTMNGPDQSGDGKAFPISNSNPDVATVVIWGGMNNNNLDVVGYAFDNFCIEGSKYVTQTETETAWGYDPNYPDKPNCTETFIESGISTNWGGIFCALVCCANVCDEWIVYGSNLNGGADPLDDAIYAYDLNAQTQTLVYDPTPIDGNQNYPNANAYDPVNQRIYLGTDDGRFFYYDIDDAFFQQLTTNENFGIMACGAWYDGKFYYVQQNTNRLYEVSIVGTNATRNQIGTVPVKPASYGDIVFDPKISGRIIGSSGAGWFWYDIGGSSGQLTHEGDGDGGHRQLAYASNGVLYAVQALSGQFYTVEYEIGYPGTFTTKEDWNSPYTFTDLASGPQCQ
jgi:hypothetical protein